ncbi:MAG: glycoside hydrolase family 88 protein [Rikenellaceae bacterium]
MNKLLLTLVALLSLGSCVSNSQIPSAEEVKQISQRVADWQITHFENQQLYRAPWNGRTVQDNKIYHDLQWQNAAFYIGLHQFSTITPDPKYRNWLIQMGQSHGFKLHEREFHADDHAVGQLYLSLYEHYKESDFIEPLKDQFDNMIENEEANNWHWWWCDALFMSPPVWAHLSKITNDPKYLNYMDSQYHMTYDKLWCEDESLFFRDLKYLDKQEENGEKIFWSRGNGWVFGGLALMIPDLPQDWAGRDFYIDLFKTMALKIKEIQREDGTWSAGLLGSIEHYPAIETSGTSFFTFGLAWGINNGLLDRKIYEPVMFKGWNALMAAVNRDGMLTHVQGVGAAPAASSAEYTEVYGSGAFLAAGAEVYKYINNFYDSK